MTTRSAAIPQPPAGMPVLLLDFDGTVCVGDAPVQAYADAAIAEIGPGDAAERIRTRLRGYLDGSDDLDGAVDGYAAVARLVDGHITPRRLQHAYRASRRALAAGILDVGAPAGLQALLASLAGRVFRMLVTNAPADGVVPTLQRIGVEAAVDGIVTDAGKPDGWDRVLPPILAGRDAAAVMAVGDIWENDLRAPLAFGCRTALIDRFDRQLGPAHLRAHRFDELDDGIRSWARDPADFARAHMAQPATTPASRL